MDLETLKGMTLKELKKKALAKGVPRDTVDELDDKQDPTQAAIDLILAKAVVAIPSAKNSNLRRQACLAGASQEDVDDALDQASMRRALITLITSKQADFIDPVGFVDPVGFWEYQADDRKFVPYTRDESLQLDIARRRRASEFGMVVGRSKLQVTVNFQVNKDGVIQQGTQKSLTTGKTRNIQRQASAWELLQTARSILEECLQEPPDAGLAKYTSPESILEILDRETQPVKLLRGSWVTKFAGSAGQSRGLPRRQDLEQAQHGWPQWAAALAIPFLRLSDRLAFCGPCRAMPSGAEAFLPRAEVAIGQCKRIRRLKSQCKDIPRLKSLNIFSISYCWRALSHPDADGQQLRAIASELNVQMTNLEFSSDFKDAGVFWDFCSLHQKDKNGNRTKKENEQFSEALACMDIWYMHTLVMTFIVNPNWARGLGLDYDCRGWTHFERSCAELIKPVRAGGFLGVLENTRPMIIEFEQSGRKLPYSPEIFAETLAQRRFTNRGDKEAVVTLYTKACMRALRGTETISLNGIKLQRHDGEQIASVLRHCCSVRLLDLSDMNMDDAGAVAIAEALSNLPCLRALEMDNNHIGSPGAQAIAEALPNLPCLKVLCMSHNSIGDPGAQAIAEALPNLACLKVLAMSHNSIGDPGAQAIAEALPNLPCLTNLHMDNNHIGSPVAQAIAEALPNLPCLKFLTMSHNSIGDPGAQAIAEALPNLPCLEIFDMGNNNIGAPGAQAMAEALPRMSKLKILYLRSNKIGDDGATLIAEALPRMSSLTDVDIRNNKVTEVGKSVLRQALVNAGKHAVFLNS